MKTKVCTKNTPIKQYWPCHWINYQREFTSEGEWRRIFFKSIWPKKGSGARAGEMTSSYTLKNYKSSPFCAQVKWCVNSYRCCTYGISGGEPQSLRGIVINSHIVFLSLSESPSVSQQSERWFSVFLQVEYNLFSKDKRGVSFPSFDHKRLLEKLFCGVFILLLF